MLEPFRLTRPRRTRRVVCKLQRTGHVKGRKTGSQQNKQEGGADVYGILNGAGKAVKIRDPMEEEEGGCVVQMPMRVADWSIVAARPMEAVPGRSAAGEADPRQADGDAPLRL